MTLFGQINNLFDKGGTNKQFEFVQSKQLDSRSAAQRLSWRWLHHLKICPIFLVTHQSAGPHYIAYTVKDSSLNNLNSNQD